MAYLILVYYLINSKIMMDLDQIMEFMYFLIIIRFINLIKNFSIFILLLIMIMVNHLYLLLQEH